MREKLVFKLCVRTKKNIVNCTTYLPINVLTSFKGANWDLWLQLSQISASDQTLPSLPEATQALAPAVHAAVPHGCLWVIMRPDSAECLQMLHLLISCCHVRSGSVKMGEVGGGGGSCIILSIGRGPVQNCSACQHLSRRILTCIRIQTCRYTPIPLKPD